MSKAWPRAEAGARGEADAMCVVQGGDRWGIREKVDPIWEKWPEAWFKGRAGPEGRKKGQTQLSTDNVHTCLLRTLMLALTNMEKRIGKKTNSGNIHTAEYFSATKRSEAPTPTTA